MNIYKTHNCGELTKQNEEQTVKVAGWVENIRDHGGVVFIDLRDHFGITQVVVHDDSLMANIGRETVISAAGVVKFRGENAVNPDLATGEIEVYADNIEILGECTEMLPFEVPISTETREDLRLKYRFLDLRNKKVHERMILRSKIISAMREKMENMGFLEMQTPILTASSPEGARDFLVPSRKHKGKFYALPQAPQIFKQLLMVSGFDKYFQVAPCFRDEDARADRSPGEFYQLDFEMAFATQEDILKIAEDLLVDIFTKFTDKKVTSAPFERITYKQSMAKYGTDKPDLRNPLEIVDLTDVFAKSDFAAFKGKPVRGIFCENTKEKPRRFYDNMLKYATEIGMAGLGYIKIEDDMTFAGPIAKFINEDMAKTITQRAGLKPGGALFFVCASKKETDGFAGQIRTKLGEDLELISNDEYKFCFIVDYPMFEYDDDGQLAFTHNPFSMPQGGLDALLNQNPTEILAYQYDVVCNGYELSSGAVRNHNPEIMKKAFEMAGYPESVILEKFGALYSAFKFGAPPHAGMAPGLDRVVMLLTDCENIREVTVFPLSSNATDLMLNAPSEVTEMQLREANIKIR